MHINHMVAGADELVKRLWQVVADSKREEKYSC